MRVVPPAVWCPASKSLISFPMLELTERIRLSKKKTFKVKLYCSCQMPEIWLNVKCLRWYYFKYVGIVDKPPIMELLQL